MTDIQIYPEWKQAALDAVEEFTFGDVVPHDWLYEHFGIKPPEYGSNEQFKKFSLRYMSYVEGFKLAMLEDNKMLLINVRGHGYQIVHPEYQTSIVVD